jgi:GT2 family glycosyltransferase
MTPRVSVIVVSHNTCEVLRQALHSIFSNPPQLPFEVIVVDAGSNDNTAAMVTEEFHEVSFLGFDNIGFAAGNNRGFERAAGEYVFILNPDTVLLPGCIDTLAGFLDTHPDVAVCGPWIREQSSLDGAEAGVNPPPPTGAIDMHERWSNRFPRVRVPASLAYSRILPRHRSSDLPVEVDWVLNAAAMIRRSSLSRSQLFDETFFIGAEEIELCQGLLAPRGFRFYLIPSAQILHFAGQSHAPDLSLRIALNALGQAAVHYRRRQIHGSNWARLDSALAFVDHLGLWLALTIVNGVRPSSARSAQRRLYGALLSTHLHLLGGGGRSALDIDCGVRAKLESMSSSSATPA